MPLGKNIPMTSPSGTSTRLATTTRTEGRAEKRLEERRQEDEIATLTGQRGEERRERVLGGRRMRPVTKLPIPEEVSSANRTTVSEYVG